MSRSGFVPSDTLVHINNKDTSCKTIKGIVKRAVLEALLDESPEFRQQFVRSFTDLLKDSDFVKDILASMWSDVCVEDTPFTRLSLTLSLARLADFNVDTSKLITLVSKSSFGSIQALAFDLINSKSSAIDQGLLNNVWTDLVHPRACINEGAAMIIRLMFTRELVGLDDLLARLECNPQILMESSLLLD